ncbi:MAG: CPBP family intramembrane metalloprotease [Bacteroidetes bacterium]|nr:CPBP family intramembrane metalloprotease [Bacteroidota bacterium]
MFIFDPDLDLLDDPSLTPGLKDIVFLQFAIISQQLSLFILPGIILMARLKNPDKIGYPEISKPAFTDIRSTVILTLCLFPILGITAGFNSALEFPEWLSGLGEWITDHEENVERYFEILISDKRAGLVVVNILMITVLPAIGEELIFRGILQRIFIRMFRSGYAGVIFTAFLFSVLHFQFLGLLPRFILGLVCGLLFYWSGKLWLSAIVHFLNNGVAMIIQYLRDSESSANPDDFYFLTQLVFLIIMLIPVISILNGFRQRAVIEEKQVLQTSDHQIEDQGS